MFKIGSQTAENAIINIGKDIEVESQNEEDKYEVRYLPIYSCKDCNFIYIEKDEYRYNTFCTKLAGQTMTIKYGTKMTPEHFKFPKFCLLTKRE